MKVALELIDSALSEPGGHYRLLVAQMPSGQVGGYVCYGPTPMTHSTWDLYWVATDADLRGRGIGSALCATMEEDIRRHGGRLVRVETSTEDGYGAAHRFYEKHGYPEACRVADFYKPGDDLILMFKRLEPITSPPGA